MEFRNGLDSRRNSLPFTAEYMDSIIEELDLFLCRYDQPRAE
jgi:hypothetical protein